MFNKDAQLSLHKKLKPFLKKDTFVRTLDSITYKACKDLLLDTVYNSISIVLIHYLSF